MSVIINILLLLLMGACMAAVAFFAGTETGMLTVSRARLISLDRQGVPRAKKLAKIVSDMSRVINTVLIGTNLFSVAASTISAVLALRLFAGCALAQSVWSVAVALMMVFGCEYMPKLLFTVKPLRRTLYVVPLYCFFAKVLRPVTWIFELLVRKVFKIKSANARRISITRDSLRSIVADRENGARIDDFSRRMIDRILTLQAMFAHELMIPIERTDRVTSLTTLEKCVELARSSGHVHLPVFDGAGRKALGVLDVFALLRTNGGTAPEGVAIDVAMTPIIIPSSMRADDILPLMRRHHRSVVFVKDEANDHIVGILTEENVLLALTGILKE